jgi:hypothetical protein
MRCGSRNTVESRRVEGVAAQGIVKALALPAILVMILSFYAGSQVSPTRPSLDRNLIDCL